MITVVCEDRGQVLLYTVDADPRKYQEVKAKVELERERDIGEPIEVEILFAFAGDLSPVADWRE